MTSIALANDDMPDRRGPSFEDLDQNKDLLIGPDEFEAFMQGRSDNRGKRRQSESLRPSRLERLDTDGDGYVNESEFNAFHEGMRRERKGKRPGRRSHDCGRDSE
jgi:hypothetical protein